MRCITISGGTPARRFDRPDHALYASGRRHVWRVADIGIRHDHKRLVGKRVVPFLKARWSRCLIYQGTGYYAARHRSMSILLAARGRVKATTCYRKGLSDSFQGIRGTHGRLKAKIQGLLDGLPFRRSGLIDCQYLIFEIFGQRARLAHTFIAALLSRPQFAPHFIGSAGSVVVKSYAAACWRYEIQFPRHVEMDIMVIRDETIGRRRRLGPPKRAQPPLAEA